MPGIGRKFTPSRSSGSFMPVIAGAVAGSSWRKIGRAAGGPAGSVRPALPATGRLGSPGTARHRPARFARHCPPPARPAPSIPPAGCRRTSRWLGSRRLNRSRRSGIGGVRCVRAPGASAGRGRGVGPRPEGRDRAVGSDRVLGGAGGGPARWARAQRNGTVQSAQRPGRRVNPDGENGHSGRNSANAARGERDAV